VKLCLRAAFWAAFFLTYSLTARDRSEIEARHGVIDFSAVELAGEDTLALDGDWKFFWKEFISPAGNPPRASSINLRVRGTWKSALYEGQPLPADGWGSYELLVLPPKNAGRLSLKIANIGTAYKLFANGTLIAQQGKPGENAATAVSRTVPVVAHLPEADAGGRILLVMHVSNFDDRHGGIWQTIRLGATGFIQHAFRENHTLATFLFGAIFMIALHHLLLFIRRPQEKSNLAFAILCVLLAVRSLVEANRYIMALFPDFPWVLNSKLAYLTFYGSLAPSAWFLRIMFPGQFKKLVLQVILWVTIPVCLAVIVLPPRVYTETLAPMQIFSLLLILYSVFTVFQGVFTKARGAKTLAFGILGLFIAATIDILTVANILNLPEVAPFGLIGFILSQSLLISMRQEDAHHDLEILATENKSLIESMEMKILERTSTIAELSAEGDAVLNSLTEGVFLINRDKVVGNKFSLKIFEILEIDPTDLAQKPFAEVIRGITGEDLSEDARLFLKVLFNANMDDETVEQLNPLHQITLRGLKSKKEKIIHFNFTRQRRNKQIMAVFVSVRDITADETLRLEIEERESRSRRQLEIVRTLFSVNPEALQAFYGSIEDEVQDIDTALSPEGNDDARTRIEKIYRAAHTIKGSAQLFKVNFVAEEVHTFEAKMQELLKREKIENLDMISVNIDYAEMQKALDEFEGMILKILKFQKEASSMHVNAIDLLKESLPKMVAEICAKLGKKAEIEFVNFSPENIPRKYFAALRDSLVQCVRNSLAHSIETPDERRSKGKNATGLIIISGRTDGDTLDISVRDDGKSFDIAAIRQRATERKVKTAAEIAALTDKDVINFIFAPGFSTAEPGGEISGRGAGMDVIAKKVEQIGGKIRIQWSGGAFTEFTFVLPKK
jgi:HPt (histidine-containing phosphotransfer) domain-containing protein